MPVVLFRWIEKRSMEMCWNIGNFRKYCLSKYGFVSSKKVEEKNISPEVAGAEFRMLYLHRRDAPVRSIVSWERQQLL